MWLQRHLDMFSEVHRGQGGWSGGRKEGRKRSGVDGVRQVRGMQAGGGADQITSPGTLQAFVRILAFTLIEMGSSCGFGTEE